MNIRLLLVQPDGGGNLALPADAAYEVRSAATRDEVRAALTDWRPDCLLFDLDLPVTMKDLFFGYWRTLAASTRIVDVVAEGRESDASARAHALLVLPAAEEEMEPRLGSLMDALLGWRSEKPAPAGS